MKHLFFLLLFVSFQFSIHGQTNKKITSCIKKIHNYSDKFEYYKALEKCNTCIEKDINSAQLYFERGRIKYWLNLMNAASQDFDKALTIDSSIFNADIIESMRWVCDTTFIIENITDSLIFPLLNPELNYRKAYTKADTMRGMLRPERTCFDVVYENLTVKVMPESKSIEGSNEITFKALNDSKVIQLDLFDYMEVEEISLNGKALNYSRLYNAIFITFDENLEKDKYYTIVVSYKGIPREAPNPPWDGGFVWKKNGDRYFTGVTCEHLGASSWWPNKDHLSDKPDSMDINILAPSGYDVIANGNLLNKTEGPDGFTNFQWHVSYPINNYNVTFYIGDFVNFNETYSNSENQKVAIDYYVLPQNLEKAKKYYSGTKRIVSVFEELFGDYPFPKDGLAFIESPFSGMEHQSAIAIGGDYGKDSVYSMVGKYDLLVVHETAHEWWGNAVAIEDIADVWINEGFATYAEHLFIEKEFGNNEYIEAVGENMFDILNIWPVVGKRDINYDAFLGEDVYGKGAAMLHSLRCVFDDDESFFLMIKEFYINSTMKINTTNDFIEHAKKYTSKELNGFFEVFLYQSAPPTLEYSYQLKHGKFRIKYKWVNVPDDFEMPFLIVFNFGQGIRVPCSTKQGELTISNVKDFYIFCQADFDSAIDTKNSFTYFFSKFIKSE
jgi:aminopeptidase N